MSLRLVSSARNLREQFKGNSSSNLTTSSGSSIATANSKTLDSNGTSSGNSVLTRQGTLLRSSSSHGNLRSSKSTQKKTLIAKVFADDSGHNEPLPDLSMEMTLLVVKRCVKEIRERGLTTKGILRQVQMGHSNKVVMDTIRLILDDDANTELSALRQVDIHLVAHAMKWAIRYSEETLVTYADYQALYLDQDRSFSRLVRDLPPTNRAILLDLFALCADVTLLAHLNQMTLVAVAKAISLSIMAEPEREFTTFDASLQQRNLWGAACEDLLRAFLRIKTTHDLAKIDQEDEVDENRYVDNITRQVKSARQRSNDNGNMPNIPVHSRLDTSVPSSAGSSIATSAGWSSAMTPTAAYGRPINGYFDPVSTPRSASPLSQQSLSRSHSLAKSNSIRSRPISPAPQYEQESLEYEEIMQDQSHLNFLRQSRNSQTLIPVDRDRRRSSVADVESLYMLPVDPSIDGYESEPEPGCIPDFADGLGWDFSKLDNLQIEETPLQDASVNRSNSSSSYNSFSTNGGQSHSPRTSQESSTCTSSDQINSGESSARSPPQGVIQRSGSSTVKARVGHAIAVGHTSPSMTPQRAKRNSLLRRSVSLDPHTMHGRVHKKPNELRHDILTRELAIQAERSQVAEDIRSRLLQAKLGGANVTSLSRGPSFSLESSPQDLERPRIPTRSASQGLGRSLSKSTVNSSKLEIDVGSLPPKQTSTGATDEITPISNPSSSSSIVSPKPQQPPSNVDKRFEVISRPKEMEVNVHFTPITPVSPKAEVKSKFHESFPDQPISPPQGYAQGQSSSKNPHKKSPTSTNTKSGQNSKTSPSSSTISSPMQPQIVSRSNSKGQANQLSLPIPLQQTASFSSTSSQYSATEGKSKAAGFIRALSFKLRSKQSDEQLKATKINNQVVGSAPAPPSVSIQPPRLELSFLGDLGGSSSSGQQAEKNPPPASAPASMHGATISGSSTSESWKRVAQDSLPVPATGADLLGVDRPKGFTGTRRTSGALFGSGNVALREQRRKSRIVMSPRSSPSLQATGTKADGKRNRDSSSQSSGRSSNRPTKGRTLSDSSYTTDDSGTLDGTVISKSSTQLSTASPKKAGEREYRFSTATLLKDGKLYYQLQWDEFSESGFQSDFFHQPEQYLTGLHQKRMSKIPAGGHGVNSSGAVKPTRSTTTQDHPSGGHVGQDQDQEWSQGPSREQRAAAMKAARQSFMALAKDPKVLAALKAGTIGGNGQATIIGTGSFPIGSTQPVMQSKPLNLNLDAVPPMPSSSQVRTSPMLSPHQSRSNSISSNNSRSSPFLREDADRLQRNISDKSSSTLSTVGTASLDSRKEIAKPGKQSTIAGGVGSSSSSLLARSPVSDSDPMAPVSNPNLPLVKPPKKNRLFGAKPKALKKSNRLSISSNQLSAGVTNNNFSNTNLTKKKRLPGVVRKDLMTKTEESLDEVFPWTCIEHTAGQESGWVMLEPVQDGAVGWVKIDRLEEEINRLAEAEQQQHRKQQEQQQQQQQHQMMEREQ
ncbi:hypothetical protein BGX27_004896 [Mortierella sp. AM989]|nr:hypothetical protein BGX27_004896 [Mortierella sp. AM989]